LTAIVAALVAALTFAVLRLGAAAREAGRGLRGSGGESALLASALQEALTALKAQERATAARAEASERLSEQILSSLTAGLIVVGKERDIRIINPAGRRMLAVDRAEPLGNYRETLAAPLSALIDECLARRAAMIRRTLKLPDGHPASDIGATVSPLFDDTGEPQGAICLFTDITTVMALEEQLRLKESLAGVGELAAGIAHEFRNGLATIHGYAKLIDVKAIPETYRPHVEGVRSEAESLGQVVTNFLNFARPAELTLARVELGAVCERAAEEIRAELRERGGHLEVRGEFGALDGDEVLLRQAFSNLLRNALQACGGDSPRVVVEGRVDRQRNLAMITVDDNGAGIPESERERVFRPFYTSKRGGTGLGLALVQKIVVFHNGRVTVGRSSLGGASLRVVLPIQPS
jgi:signal transduction histidine kinase